MLLEQQMIEQARYLSLRVFLIRDGCAKALKRWLHIFGYKLHFGQANNDFFFSMVPKEAEQTNEYITIASAIGGDYQPKPLGTLF